MKNQLADVLTIHHYALNLFPYWTDELKEEWEKKVLELIVKVNNGFSLKIFYQELMQLSALLDDGHTLVYLPIKIKNKLSYSPVKLALIGDDWVIISGNKKYQTYFYEPIKRINNVSESEFLAQISSLFWKSNLNFSMHLTNLNSSFIFDDGQQVIEFENGNQLTIPFVDNPISEVNSSQLKIESDHELILNSESLLIWHVADKIIIKINHFMSNEVVDNFYKYISMFKNAKQLIFDMRGNPGGNSGLANEISQAFFSEELVMEKSFRQVIDSEYVATATMTFYDGASSKAEQSELYQRLNHQFLEERIEKSYYKEYQGLLADMPIIILQDELTYSSGENFIINFDNVKRATLIGQTTAGSTGQPAWLKLKTGGMFMITAKKVTYPNGQEHHNVGIKPDIMIIETLEEKKNKVDKVLSYALNL